MDARRHGGGRVLRHGHPAVARRRRGQRDAPGAGRHAVVQAVLLLRRRPRGWRSTAPSPSSSDGVAAPRNDQLAPHAQRRRHLDAGQVGVPVVRGVGPRLPLSRPDAGGRGLRQAAARPDAERRTTCTRAARSPPTSGTSATSTRRCMPGRRSSPTASTRRGGARATSTGSSAPSTSCCSTSPGGSTARTATGSNVFEGGFLGLDNIGVFDRSAPLPTGGYLEQADGTAWMALFCQNMLEIARGAGAGATRLTRTWRSSSSSTSSGSRRR